MTVVAFPPPVTYDFGAVESRLMDGRRGNDTLRLELVKRLVQESGMQTMEDYEKMGAFYKTNISVQLIALAWAPFWRDESGSVTQAWE